MTEMEKLERALQKAQEESDEEEEEEADSSAEEEEDRLLAPAGAKSTTSPRAAELMVQLGHSSSVDCFILKFLDQKQQLKAIMTKWSVLFILAAAVAVASDGVNAGNLRVRDTERFLTQLDASMDGSSSLSETDSSSGDNFLTETSGSDQAEGSSDSTDADDDSDDDVDSLWLPGTVKPAAMDEASTQGSEVFDKSNLTWWK
ncbi:hypothetical protein BBJ28_00011890 [Nothophytophthora sp. Chile5]|nr:hypothetical protein BBJ28_00011890 [Nothophytophthora sp. Chile5]